MTTDTSSTLADLIGSSSRPLISQALYKRIKRALDFGVALVALIVVVPILAITAATIAVAMGRPVLFRQERPGFRGELFTLIKFRTMDSGLKSDSERLTKLGRFLRSTSIDELPQLWNVLRGEMSLIGPRPLLPEYLPLYSDRQSRRHEVRPGITGLAQVTGRNVLNWDDRLETDVLYAENESLALDLRIIIRTVIQVGKRSGISADGAATMPHFTGTSEPANEAS